MTRLIPALALVFAICLYGGSATPAAAKGRDTLFQYSTIDSLLAGLYDGEMTVGAIQIHGNFGLGTFNGLDGEMIVLDGTVYQARGNGELQVAHSGTQVPFTSVTFFDADRTAPVPPGIDLVGLHALLDALAPNPNIYHAIRVDGLFRSVQLRVAPRQTKPYAPLAQVIDQQAVFELRDVRGTLVGLRTPKYLAGLNVPGYHFHFVTDDRTRGGHVFGISTGSGAITVDHTPGFTVALPHSRQFAALDLNKARHDEMQRVEKAQTVPSPAPYAAPSPVPMAVAAPIPAPTPAKTAEQKTGFFESLIACKDDALPDNMRMRNQRHKAAKRPSGKTDRCK